MTHGERDPCYDPERHALVVPPPPGPGASKAERLKYRATLLHEAGHASREGWECYAEFGWLHEAANDFVAHGILRALEPGRVRPGNWPRPGYMDEMMPIARIVGSEGIAAAAIRGQRAVCEAVEAALQRLARETPRPIVGTVEGLRQLINEALGLVRHRWRSYTGSNPLTDLLTLICCYAFGSPLRSGLVLDTLGEIGKQYRRLFGL